MKSLILIRNQKGQGLVEYLIIVALVAVATIGIMRTLGQNTSAQFANITYALQGSNKKARKDQVNKTATEKKDLSDFMSGASRDGEE